jgi:hypothetical protein
LLSEIPHIIGEIGFEAADLFSSTIMKWFDRIKTALRRVLSWIGVEWSDIAVWNWVQKFG